MANKKTRVTYGGINQDVAKSRVQDNMYYDAKNIKLTPVDGQSFGALSNAYGNLESLEIPRPYVNTGTSRIVYGDKELPYTNREIDDIKPVSSRQEIIGHVVTINGAILFTTDGTLDCVWEVPDLDKDILDIDLLYMREMGFSKEFPIQAIFNYENELIQKVYWVDSVNYLRFLNTKQSLENDFDEALIDVPVSSINSKSTIDISKPTVEDGGGGGVHTAGMVQYGYTLYNLNGAETSLSPLSDLFPLDKGVGNGGGAVNEVVGAMPVVVIEDVDKKYTYLKLYSVKYTEYNGVPEISLIYDGSVGNYTRFTHNDTGTSNLGNIDIATFLFLGADPIKPSHIVSKDNYLFASNNKATAYKLDIDTRAYSYNEAGSSAEIFTDVIYDANQGEIPYTGTKWDVASQGYEVPNDHDAVNLNFDEFRFKDQGTSGQPGRVLLDQANLAKDIYAQGPDELFPATTGQVSSSMFNVQCDPTNTSPNEATMTMPIPGGTNGRAVATRDGYFSVTFIGEAEWLPSNNRNILSSVDAYVTVYDNATSGTVISTAKMDSKPITGFTLNDEDQYFANVPILVGQAAKVTIVARNHYSNDTCPYQCDDINADGSYAGDGPYQGPDETGSSVYANINIDYRSFGGRIVDKLDRVTPVPLTAVNGETSVVNGKYIADYTGTVNTAVNVQVDRRGTVLDPIDQYSLAIYRNGGVVNSFKLPLNSAGLNVFNYSPTFNVAYGDEIEFVMITDLVTSSSDPTGNPNADAEVDLGISGNFTVLEGVSSGDNGEGGTGKYLSYSLTRTDEADLGLSLRQAKFFKDNEIYRIGIVFFNSIGQASEAKWIADFKAPEGNLEGQFNTLKVELNSAFYAWVNTLDDADKPTNYTIVRAIRNSTDKTIISQGMMTSMFVQDYTPDKDTSDTDAKKAEKNAGLIKTPVPMTRGYGSGTKENNTYYPIFPTRHNRTMNRSIDVDPGRGTGDKDQDPRTSTPRDVVVDEIYRDNAGDQRRVQSWQYTKIMQMYSPEATFGSQISTTDKDELHLLGYMPRKEFNVWDYNIDIETFGPHLNNKKDFGINVHGNLYPYLTGGYGVIGPSYRRWKSGTEREEYVQAGYETKKPAYHARRTHFRKSFQPLERASEELKYEILNKPEITNVGQGITSYNSDKGLQYTNKLTLVISDEKKATNSNTGGSDAPNITSVQSEGNRCLTMVLGDNQMNHEDRLGLDDLYAQVGTGEWDVELFGEIRKVKSYVYSGALYGGYDVSSRSRTEYVSIGDAYDVGNSQAIINSPGDTYVQTFINTRLTKVPGTVYTTKNQCIVETLEYLVETTINLEERNDTSISSWDTIVDPTAEEGTSYNNVYSTDSTVKTYSTDSLKLRAVEQKEVEIIASKAKIPGEFVDNWVDFQPNEVQYLDGKYGPISNVVNHWDQLYAFQDFAVAKVAVNPRVQIQDADSVSIQLGTGRVLHDYQYISTKSGSLNKWAITSTNSGIYYLDANLKQIQRIQPGKGIEGVSEAKGLHGFLQKSLDRDSLEIDNPLINEGAVLGYDIVNGDIFTTVHNEEGDTFTVSFNEKMNSFTSFYDFHPGRFIVKGERMFTVPTGNNKLWTHTKDSEYQNWYGTKHESSITLLINTDVPGTEKVFNNIEFDSEVTLEDVDIPNSTIDSIEAWTTYQKSGKIPLTVGRDLKRKFRTWRAFIPRQEASRNRLRDKWLFLKLGFDPEDNKKLILHDIIINYTV